MSENDHEPAAEENEAEDSRTASGAFGMPVSQVQRTQRLGKMIEMATTPSVPDRLTSTSNAFSRLSLADLILSESTPTLSKLNTTTSVSTLLSNVNQNQRLISVAATETKPPTMTDMSSLVQPPEPPHSEPSSTAEDPAELSLDEVVTELEDIGFILQCDGCSKRVLRENSHGFATTDDDDLLCGGCRSMDRSFS